jgi:hypothetical protein
VSQSAIPGASTHRVRRRSEAVNVDRGQLVGRGLKDVAVVMDLHDLAPVGGRASSGRDGRRLEWFAEVCENLPDRPQFRDEGNEPDVTTAVRALQLFGSGRKQAMNRIPGGLGAGAYF